ncbi:MAG TPA: pyruvate ferredoxin oxidoreductase [Thermoplasmata archaeon]|nr:pyruvate ferredoxin oxidoreductase [Thermoplasmata archaeon]
MKLIMDTANHIAGEAAKAARAEVVAAYPITPQTTVVEYIQKLISNGEFDADFICVESEHSAMAATIGASATGVRTFTATSSHGLLYMHEMLHWAALARLPIVMVNINRTIGPGWNIWADHQDSMAQRDTGWLQFHCGSNQEVFDTVIQSYKIAEAEEIQLPIMVNFDAFILSHTSMPVSIPDQPVIDKFLPKRKPVWKLDSSDPLTHGNIIPPDPYLEIRKSMQESQDKARDLIRTTAEEWKKLTGFWHGGTVEEYRAEDADLVVLAMGTLGSEAKVAVDRLRKERIKAGVFRIRSFRPFPIDEIKKLSEETKLVVVDKALSFGGEGVLYSEVKSALYGRKNEIFGWIAGLGGKDVSWQDLVQMVKAVKDGKAKPVNWQKGGKGAITGFI